MDRRSFIVHSASLVAAAGLLPGPLSLHARSRSSAHVRLFRFDGGRGGFVASSGAEAAPGDSGQPLRLSLEGFHPAAFGGVHALDIQAAFDRGDGERWRFFAWRYREGDRHGSSRASGFDLTPGVGCRLEFAMAHAPSAPPSVPALDLVDMAALAPGRYLAVVGAHAPEALPFSGDWRRPLGDMRAFDYLSLRLEAQPEAVDLSIRADLACVAGCPVTV